MNIEEIISITALCCYFLSHVIQYLPPEFTEKVPDSLMRIINVLASKHGADKAALTDIKGNIK